MLGEVSGQDLQFLRSLAPPDPSWLGRGAVPLLPDPRDHSLLHLPGVRAMLTLGAPASFDLSPSVRSVYDQGSSPACVAFSSCAMKSVEDSIDRNETTHY